MPKYDTEIIQLVNTGPTLPIVYILIQYDVPGSGHIMTMPINISGLNSVARLTSLRYINTTGTCIEFYFWLENVLGKTQPVINVWTISEERMEMKVYSTVEFGTVLTGWNRFITKLPEGIFQIIIEGVRSEDGPSGISIDNLFLDKCSVFGNDIVPRWFSWLIIHPQFIKSVRTPFSHIRPDKVFIRSFAIESEIKITGFCGVFKISQLLKVIPCMTHKWESTQP